MRLSIDRFLVIAVAIALLLGMAPSFGQEPAEPPRLTLEELLADTVRSTHHHGISYTAARSFGPEAVPFLLKMLQDEGEKAWWANVVNLLGMIGDPRATDPLIQFLEKRFQGTVDDPTWNALLAVVQSLGFLAEDPKSKAFVYLRDGIQAEAWRGRGLAWTYPTLGKGDREVLLAKLAINGLGISGAPEAEAALRGLVRARSGDPGTWVYYQDNVSEALETLGKLQRSSREEVFGGDG